MRATNTHRRFGVMLAGLMAALIGLVLAGGAIAGEPTPWQLGQQAPVTPVAEELHSFHSLLLVVIVAITIFVLLLLLYVMFRFSEKRNPNPSKTTHNTLIEVLWTVVPVVILVVIAIPSFKLLYFTDRSQDAEFTIKAIGRQWFWSYEYPDHGNFTFDAFMLPESEASATAPRLLATDNAVVLPVDTKIRILVTASDVLHAFAVPAFGIKMDAVPGRLNETWVEITKPGTYYGQCSELCGTGHAYMPIMVRAVPKEEFTAWVAEAQAKFARLDEPPAKLAKAAPDEDQSAKAND